MVVGRISDSYIYMLRTCFRFTIGLRILLLTNMIDVD